MKAEDWRRPAVGLGLNPESRQEEGVDEMEEERHSGACASVGNECGWF